MTMPDTDFNYPPTTTIVLEAAVDTAQRRLEDCSDRVADLEADDDATRQALQEARSDYQDADNQHDALQWAVTEFAAEAEITLRAHTSETRSEVLDTINRTTMGEVGSNQLQDWLVAAAIVNAPWLSGGEDIRTRADITGELPPALTDWLARELEDLNDLGN